MHLPWLDVAPGDGPVISTSVTAAETATLARLAAAAGDVLEIGSAFGYSAIVMALAGAHVTAVDPHTWVPDSLAGMERNVAAYGVADRVEILHESSGPVLRTFELAIRNVPLAGFGMVFIDGDHTADAVRADVAGALKVLRPGGVLACHDYGEDCCCPGVRQALDELFPDGPDELTGSLFVVKT